MVRHLEDPWSLKGLHLGELALPFAWHATSYDDELITPHYLGSNII